VLPDDSEGESAWLDLPSAQPVSLSESSAVSFENEPTLLENAREIFECQSKVPAGGAETVNVNTAGADKTA
jgi:hypothetical protein